MVFRVVAERNRVKESQNNILKKLNKNPKKRMFKLTVDPTIINNIISENKNVRSSNNSKYKTIEIIFETIILLLETGEEYKIIALLLEKSPEIISLAMIIVVNRYNKIEKNKNVFQKRYPSIII